MAHEIFGSRAFARQTEPTWHRLGVTPGDVNWTAVQALKRLGNYRVALQPLFARADGKEFPIPHQAIFRFPTPDDKEYRLFGVVTDDYVLVQPQELCEICDKTIVDRHGKSVPVETMAALKKGSTLFITYRLPNFGLRGEEIETYLMAINPMTGTDAMEVCVVHRRVVCNNTLIIALAGASERYRMVHDATLKWRLVYWMSDIYTRFESRGGAIREAFAVLAAHKAGKEAEARVLETTYPEPSSPGREAPPEVVERRMSEWEARKAQAYTLRGAASDLFHGGMTGHKKDLAGSFWYLYNAVVELEDNRRGGSDQTAITSSLIGDRATNKAIAFEACMELAR